MAGNFCVLVVYAITGRWFSQYSGTNQAIWKERKGKAIKY